MGVAKNWSQLGNSTTAALHLPGISDESETQTVSWDKISDLHLSIALFSKIHQPEKMPFSPHYR